MELADYLAVARRRGRLIALAVVLCTAASAVLTWHATPVYRTSTRLLVSASASDSAIDEITKRQLASQRAVAYAQYASTAPAVEAAAREAGVARAPQVAAAAEDASPFLLVTVTSPDRRAAAAVANAYAAVLPRVVTQLDQAPTGSALPQLTVLEAASVPTRPFSPQPVRNLLVGLALGLVAGAALALLRETLDTTVRRSTDLERLSDVGLLGVVPQEHEGEGLVVATRPRSQRTEAYRQVRTALDFTGPAGAPRSLVVTSAASGDGKSTLAANLACAAALTGRAVVLVDADLRRPTVASLTGLPAGPGLADVLAGRVALQDALQPLRGTRVTVLPAGTLPQAPSELLGSPAMRQLVAALEERFDLVVIDTPPVLPVTDAQLVASAVAGVVVVARLARTTTTSLRRTLELLAKVDAPVLGLVANGAREERDKGYGYGSEYLSAERVPPTALADQPDRGADAGLTDVSAA